MSGALFTVSGVDLRQGAQTVFVWRRLETDPKFKLLGSGAVAKAEGPDAPAVGTFNVTVMLPHGARSEDVVVTDNVSNEDFVTDVSLTPAARAPRVDRVVRTSLSDG
jgi:hypothetical protein